MKYKSYFWQTFKEFVIFFVQEVAVKNFPQVKQHIEM